jgi:Ca2+-binding RTX toxin-like protein
MDADGQNQHQLVPPPGGGGAYFDPVWSPDGKTIAFPHWSGGLHEALADGSRETTVAVIDVTGPSWTSANPGASLSSTGAPIIGGDARVGEPIEAGAGSWAGAEPFAFSYSWQRCNSAGLSCAAIAGAGGDTYTPAAADVGSTVKATVTATSPFVVGSVSSTTPTMGPIAAARPYSDVPPTINGSTTVGQTLLAANDAAAWTGGPSFSFRWRRCSGGGACGDIGGAVGTTYTLTTSDEGHTIRLAVTGTNAGGSSTVTSRATAAIAAAPGGGGGGGGGGGVGSIPDLKVTLSATKTTVQPNDETDFTVIVANNGGAGALQTHLAIVLPATMTLLGAPAYDVGSGCTGTQSIDCFLDYVANGGKATVRFAVHVGGTGAQTVTATATSDREANPADNSASLVITVATSTPPPPPPPPPTKGVTKVGTAHNDVLRGTNRNDTLRGMGGNDTLWGLGGNDLLVGGTGRDTLYGGGGNDTLLAREGQRDVVNCGTGRDTATVDKVDVVKGCETVRRR